MSELRKGGEVGMMQIDMPMPKCCDECFALDDHGDYPFCLISQDQRGYTFNVRENRMPTCPLKAQEVVEPEPKEVIYDNEHMSVYCPSCDNRLAGLTHSGAVVLETEETPSYCWMCGQAVKW